MLCVCVCVRASALACYCRVGALAQNGIYGCPRPFSIIPVAYCVCVFPYFPLCQSQCALTFLRLCLPTEAFAISPMLMFATVFGMDCADVYGAQKRCLLAVDCSYYGCIGCRYRHHRKSMHTMAFFCSTPSLLTAARKQKMLNFFFFHVVLQPVLCNYRFSSFCILTESARNHHAIVHMNNVASILWFFFFCLGCLSVARLKKKHRLLTRCIQHELRRNYRKL